MVSEKPRKIVIESLFWGIAIGVLLGTTSGLIPGVHINTMAGVLLGLQGVLMATFGAEAVAFALFSALITHTFLDIVPSTYLGIPDADTALSVLPAHGLCLEGRGMEAIRISALGSAWAVVLAMPILALFLAFLPSLQPFLDWGIGIILVGVAGFLIIRSESPEWSAAIFFVSGMLGMFSFHYAFLAWHTLGGTSLLMPLLSGLFGVSVLVKSSHGPMPDQEAGDILMETRELLRNSILGTLAGAVVGWLPGLSNAAANALLLTGIRYDTKRRGYIAATSAANTSNAFLALAAFFAISRTRNGVMVALSQQEFPPLHLLLLAGTIAAVVAYLLTLQCSHLSRLIRGLDVRNLGYVVCGFIALLTFLLTGPFGVFILILATIIGLIPSMVNIPRVFCMGSVMLPLMCISFGLLI